MLFETATQNKLVDTDRRVSIFRAIKDERLFALSDQLVAHLSSLDPNRDFTLVRSDCTHIKYATGGFFETHEDYLSLTSNIIEEWTLLVNVQTSEDLLAEGGETVIHLHGGVVSCTSTTTPGSALAFRKDLPHEGRAVTRNSKEILSLNLWATAKASPQSLFITFPGEKTATRGGKLELEALAQGQTSYVLPVTEILALPDANPLQVIIDDATEKISYMNARKPRSLNSAQFTGSFVASMSPRQMLLRMQQ
jgi:hypothetical protein